MAGVSGEASSPCKRILFNAVHDFYRTGVGFFSQWLVSMTAYA